VSPGSETERPRGPSDEFDFISWIRAQVVDSSPRVTLGIGDDCAALSLPEGQVALVTTDMLVEGVHYSPDQAAPSQVGRKALARGLSDIAAMAGEAIAVLVAMAAPRHVSVSYIQEVFRGMKAASRAWGVPIAGGDLSVGSLPLTITVTAIGAGRARSLALRSGVRTGDVLMVTGELGGALAGRHLTFDPRLAEARWLRDAADLGGMIDISDGLAADAGHLARESRVGLELWEEAIPVSAAAHQMAATSGRTPLEHALHDGEDYELLFSVPARDAERLLERRDAPVRLTCIGEAISDSGLWIRRRGEKRRPLQPKGWVHRF